MFQKFFRVVWAENGDKQAIPDANQPDGSVSFDEGWSPDYELAAGDPDYKTIERQKHNQLMSYIQGAIQQYQVFGTPEWITSADNNGSPYEYARDARVRYTADAGVTWSLWASLVDANTATPGTDPTKWVEITSGSSVVPAGYINGLITSNNTADTPATDIDISTGVAAATVGNNAMNLASIITKRINAVWTAGGVPAAAVGGRASAVALNTDQWYRVFAIGKLDGTVDAGFDTDASATNLLADAAGAGYTLYRQIGWVYYETGNAIRPFYQNGDVFVWNERIEDLTAGVSTVGANVTLTVPPWTVARVQATTLGGSNQFGILTETRMTNVIPSNTQHDTYNDIGASSTVQVNIRSDASSQIRYRLTALQMYISTIAWTDTRGKQ